MRREPAGPTGPAPGDPAAAAVSPDAAVSARALTRRFGELTAVDGLTFDVAPGELFGIVGPDGAGKTTTLRMLAGVLPPGGGEAEVAGVSVVDDPEGVKPHVAYMAQRFGLYEDLTVQENLDFYADIFRVPRRERPARLDRLYAFSRLGEFRRRLAGDLSGGMKQKLALSCALIHHPEVLLLDEPTFGVDPISRRDLWLILHQMVGEGVTVVVSTSYLDEAERCDRVALLHRGRLLALDRPAALQAGLGGRLLSVRSARPRLARDALRRAPGTTGAALFGEAVHVVLAEGTSREDVERALASAGVDVLAIEEIEPSLEDVFIRRVQRTGDERDPADDDGRPEGPDDDGRPEGPPPADGGSDARTAPSGEPDA